ncbi:MAG: hypothetical protein M3361_09230, partial [Candidatus Tectomicrobia bacterium]|nr:hypothetical protein [Candidatus Tectomicrobia bacterium]
IAILIAMLLLAIPLGLAIDALGWFFFGGIMQWLEQLWFKMGGNRWMFFIKSTMREFEFECCCRFFGISEGEGRDRRCCRICAHCWVNVSGVMRVRSPRGGCGSAISIPPAASRAVVRAAAGTDTHP